VTYQTPQRTGCNGSTAARGQNLPAVPLIELSSSGRCGFPLTRNFRPGQKTFTGRLTWAC